MNKKLFIDLFNLCALVFLNFVWTVPETSLLIANNGILTLLYPSFMCILVGYFSLHRQPRPTSRRSRSGHSTSILPSRWYVCSNCSITHRTFPSWHH